MKLGRIIIDIIFIYKSDLLDVKKELYHQTMRIITKNMCDHRQINITDEVLFLYLVLKISN